MESGEQECAETSLSIFPKDGSPSELSGELIGIYSLHADVSDFCPGFILSYTGQMVMTIEQVDEIITGEATLSDVQGIRIDGYGECHKDPQGSFTGDITGIVSGEIVELTIDFGDPDLFTNIIQSTATFKDGTLSGPLELEGAAGDFTVSK